jgi:hypothetical protein
MSNAVLKPHTGEAEIAPEVVREDWLSRAVAESVPFKDSVEAEPALVMAAHDAQSDVREVETPGHVSSLTPGERVTPIEVGAHDIEIVSTQISTELGGLFCLINLGLYLNLYGDFTSPAKPGLELVIWDFVELVGRELMGDAHADDPIWSLLAELAGRSTGEPAGENFEPEDEWRLSPDWLPPFSSDQPWQWGASRGRLRVLHPEGFAVLDLKLEHNPREQRQRELAPYGIDFSSLLRRRRDIKPPGSTTVRRRRLRRWLSLLMPYVRARLRVALQLESDANVATTLCRCRARVHTSAAHVDIHFDLADLPLPVRFAGLDRDPGWVPAAGRFIAFHFD